MREFRASHSEFERLGARVAGVTFDPPERAARWARKLELPYPLLSDTAREAGAAFGLIRRIGLGGWSVELLRRATLLAGADGMVRAVWEDVRVKGHAAEVLAALRALQSLRSPDVR